MVTLDSGGGLMSLSFAGRVSSVGRFAGPRFEKKRLRGVTQRVGPHTDQSVHVVLASTSIALTAIRGSRVHVSESLLLALSLTEM
jgi:hypothetical protein